MISENKIKESIVSDSFHSSHILTPSTSNSVIEIKTNLINMDSQLNSFKAEPSIFHILQSLFLIAIFLVKIFGNFLKKYF